MVAIPQVITEDRASGAQFVDGSLKFNSSKLYYLTRTPTTAGNRGKWTWSCWCKRGEKIGNANGAALFAAYSNNNDRDVIRYGGTATDSLDAQLRDGTNRGIYTTSKFRDTGWYHNVVTYDSTVGVKIYVNGIEQPKSNASGGNATLQSQINNTVDQYIGARESGGNIEAHWDGQMSQVYFLDGQSLGPENFGFTDPLTNTWRPKKYNVSKADTVLVGSPTYASSDFKTEGNKTSDQTGLSFGSWTSYTGAETKIFKNSTDTAFTLNIYLGGGTADRLLWYSDNLTDWTFIGNTNPNRSYQLSGHKYYATSEGSGSTTLTAFPQNGINSFYLPMDGNTPIGKDQSGNGNDWTPIGFGSNSIDKATGARPILNTVNGGTSAASGVFGSKVSSTIAVTVSNATGNNKYYFDTVLNPTLALIRGATITFDTTDSSNNSHPFKLSSINADSSGGAEYTDGVAYYINGSTVTGSNYVSSYANNGGGTGFRGIKWTIPHNVSTTYYYCTQHNGMGNNGRLNSTTDETKADPYAWKCVLALPLIGNDDDESKNINCTQSAAKVVSPNGNAQQSTLKSNFYGGSFVFDGNGDYLSIPASSDFDFGGGDYTIEWWMYWENRTGYQTVYDCGYTATNSTLIQSNTSTSRFIVYAQGANVAEETTNAPLNRWIHYAFVRNGNNVTLYRDGSISYAGTHSGNTHGSSSSGVRIGSDVHNYDFEGNIQDFRIYKGVAKYTSEFIPASTSPDFLPDSPSGITGKTKLTKITEGAVTGFDSNKDYLTVAASSDFEFTGDYTIEMFIYHNTLAADSVPFATGGSGSPDQLYINTLGEFYHAYGQTGNVNAPAGTIVVGKWQHIAVSKQGTNLRMFVDGKLVASSNNHSSTIGSSSAAPYIGMRGDGSHSVEGFISNLRVVKGTALYTSEFTPPTEPLTAVTNTKLLCCQSNTSATEAAVVPPNEPFSGAGGATGTGTTSDYLKVSSIGHSDFSVDGDFTFEWWHYRAAANANNGFMWTIGDSNTATGLELYWGSTGSALKLYTNGGPNSVTATAATGWHHYAVVRSGNTIKVYYDGTEGGSFTNTNTFSGNVTIGGEFYNGNITGGMNGPMSQFRFVKGSAVYTSNFTAPTTALTAITNTKLLTLQGSTPFTDNSGTNKTIEVFGTVITDFIAKNGNAVATNFNPFTDDINTIRGRESGYPTINPLYPNPNGVGTLSNGNLTHTTAAGNGQYNATLSIKPNTGKFYWEVTKQTSSNIGMIGITDMELSHPEYNANNVGSFSWYIAGPRKQTAGVDANYGSGVSENDVVGVAYDSDVRELRFYLNGVDQGVAFDSSSIGEADYYPAFSAGSSTTAFTYSVNFGQKPFKFPPPDGFQPLSLSTVRPDKVVARPDQYVNAMIYSGTNNSGDLDLTSTNTKFTPDFVWTKTRTGGNEHHAVYDSVRGPDKRLMPSDTQVEATTTANDLKAFIPGGFTMNGQNGHIYYNGYTHVAWMWKAGGSTGQFNVDDVGYANASDVNMNVGGVRGIQNVTAGNDYQAGWAGPSLYWAAADSWSNLPVENDNTPLAKGKWDTAETLSNNHTFAPGDFRQSPANGSGGFVLRATTTVTLKFEVYYHITEIAVTDTDAETWGNRTVVATNPAQGSFVEATGKCFWFSTNTNIPNVAAMGTVYNAPAQPTTAATGCSVGTKQGFSIVSYTSAAGDGSSTIPHGLSQTPDFVLIKNRDTAVSSQAWPVWHSGAPTSSRYLDSTNPWDATEFSYVFNNTAPDSNVVTVGANSSVSSANRFRSYGNGDDFIMYCWHNVPGLQKFGTFYSNGNANNAFVELGFKPKLVFWKFKDNSGGWFIYDSERTTYANGNPLGKFIALNSNAAEGDATPVVDFLSNGFKVRANFGGTAQTLVYAAWAEAPAVNLYGGQSNAR